MFYEYKVTYWSEYDESDKEDRGLVFARDYSEAASKVQNDYSNLIDMYLQEWDTSCTVSLDELKEGFKLYN